MPKKNLQKDNTIIKYKNNLTLDEILGINTDNKLLSNVKEINHKEVNKEVNK